MHVVTYWDIAGSQSFREQSQLWTEGLSYLQFHIRYVSKLCAELELYAGCDNRHGHRIRYLGHGHGSESLEPNL